jgi:CDP-paratose 2-epimerase
VSGFDVITGGAGFIGTNLADRLLREDRRVRLVDDLSRPGVAANLGWIERRHGDALEVEIADIRDAAAVGRALRGTDRVFHLAAQVAVTTSLDEPRHDAEVNLVGTLNVLEAARAQGRPPQVLFTSTNKVYGALDDVVLRETGERYEPVDAEIRANGVGEQRPLAFCTPYGCSKGAADQYVLDYAKSFGVPSVVFRMSCIYGPHQCGNEDQGWVAHFAISALEGQPITLYGDGRQVRDILFVEDLADAFLLASRRMDDIAGRAFNIGGGPANAVSLVDVIDAIERLRGDRPELRFGDWRTGDQRYYVSDTSRFGRMTGWRPRVAPDEGIARLHAWLEREQEEPRFTRTGALAQ